MTAKLDMLVSKKSGPLVGSPYNKGHSILGSILEPLIFENSHMSILTVAMLGGLPKHSCFSQFKLQGLISCETAKEP